ncbi:MAG: universal stress protein [Gemmatimonadota bacterium]
MSPFAAKNILCPVDLSPASSTVLRWARLLAETYRGNVTLLYADQGEWPPYLLPSRVEEMAGQARRHRAALEEALAGLGRETLGASVPHEVAVAEGHPVEAILGHARTRRPDLVVMGSHGRSGIARWRLGSVAENVIRESAVPTLVVRAREGAGPRPAISQVLCPVNFTDLSRGCLEIAAGLAGAFGARLSVMHAAEQGVSDLQAARDRLCAWVPADARGHCELVEVVRRGDAAEQILLLAREQGVDLIVLGAQRRPLLEFTTLGTTTERVTRHAESAVLVLPRST